MQTLTIFQFQAALLGSIRAMPTAADWLQRGLSSVLTALHQGAVSAADPVAASRLDTLPDEPVNQTIYGLPTVLLSVGQGAADSWISPYQSTVRSELVLLQAIAAELVALSGSTNQPITHRTLWAQVLPRLRPVLDAVDVVWPDIVWPDVIGSDCGTGWGFYSAGSASPTPTTAALAALLQSSESYDLTVRLAQNMTQESGAEPELAGAIAGFLWGLCKGQPQSPRTDAEQLVLSQAQQLWGHWAGLGHIAVISPIEPTSAGVALSEVPAVLLP